METESTRQHASSATDQAPPRKRVRRACVACRSNKLRCSGDLPECERCVSKRISCSYERSRGESTAKLRSGETASCGNELSTSDDQGLDQPLAVGQRTANAAHSSRAARTLSTQDLSLDPSKCVIQLHIDAFFQFIYPAGPYSFMHRGSFLRSWHSGKMARSLVLVVVGVASRFTDLKSLGSSVPGVEWVDEAEREIVGNLDLISIPKLQILLLLIYDRIAAGKLAAVWSLLALASRIAHGLKLNVPTQAIPFTNQECRRRMMWCVYAMDKLTNSGSPTGFYPSLCPRESMHVQLPCDERSFALEFECETHFLSDLERKDFHNASKLGVSAYLIRVLDLRDQMLVYFSTLNNDAIEEPRSFPLWHPESPFWRFREQLSDLATCLPPEMQDSEHAVYIRANSSDVNGYIMVQTWLQTCWCELLRHALPKIDPSAANQTATGITMERPIVYITSTPTPPDDFMALCRAELYKHAAELHQFWKRVHTVHHLSCQFYITDCSIAPCVLENTMAYLQTWEKSPELITEGKTAVEAALKFNFEILGSLSSVSQYVAAWVSMLRENASYLVLRLLMNACVARCHLGHNFDVALCQCGT